MEEITTREQYRALDKDTQKELRMSLRGNAKRHKDLALAWEKRLDELTKGQPQEPLYMKIDHYYAKALERIVDEYRTSKTEVVRSLLYPYLDKQIEKLGIVLDIDLD